MPDPEDTSAEAAPPETKVPLPETQAERPGPDPVAEITAQELSAVMGDGRTQIVDVRDLDFFIGHIPGARHVPCSEFEECVERLAKEFARSGKLIVFLCMDSVRRARRCASCFLGYVTENVPDRHCDIRVLTGGFHHWENCYATQVNGSRFISRQFLFTPRSRNLSPRGVRGEKPAPGRSTSPVVRQIATEGCLPKMFKLTDAKVRPTVAEESRSATASAASLPAIRPRRQGPISLSPSSAGGSRLSSMDELPQVNSRVNTVDKMPTMLEATTYDVLPETATSDRLPETATSDSMPELQPVLASDRRAGRILSGQTLPRVPDDSPDQLPHGRRPSRGRQRTAHSPDASPESEAVRMEGTEQEFAWRGALGLGEKVGVRSISGGCWIRATVTAIGVEQVKVQYESTPGRACWKLLSRWSDQLRQDKANDPDTGTEVGTTVMVRSLSAGRWHQAVVTAATGRQVKVQYFQGGRCCLKTLDVNSEFIKWCNNGAAVEPAGAAGVEPAASSCGASGAAAPHAAPRQLWQGGAPSHGLRKHTRSVDIAERDRQVRVDLVAYMSPATLAMYFRSEGTQVVDVRDEEFRRGHIPGARHICHEGFDRELPDLAREFGGSTKTLVFLDADSRILAPRCACSLLRHLESRYGEWRCKIYVLYGGYAAWERYFIERSPDE